MACDKALSYTFAVYEFYPDGREYDTGKTFSISKEENDRIMDKFRYGHGDGIDDYGILLIMFEKLFDFTIGPNGFRIVWDKDEETGALARHVNGCLYWAGPHSPTASKIGGNWWRIKRIT